MRRGIKLLFWIIGIGFVVGTYVGMTNFAKGWFENSLTKSFGTKVTVRTVHLAFPPGIHLSGIIGPSVSLQEAVVGLSLWALLRGRPGIDVELTALKLSLERDLQGRLALPWAAGSRQEARFKATQPKGAPILLDRLRIRGGGVSFLDRKVAPEVAWVIRDIRVSLKSSSGFRGYAFSFMGELAGPEGRTEGSFEGKGELFQEGTGKAEASVRHEALERLAPYVRDVLGTAPVQGTLNLSSHVTFHQGMMVAQNELMARRVLFASEEPTVLGPVGGRLVELLTGPDGTIRLSFVVKGRIGESLDWSDLVKSTLQEAMRQALARSIQRTLTDVEELKPVEELIRKGLESLGR